MILGMRKADGNRLLLTLVDNELIGKRFEEGELQLDLSSPFFSGEEKSEEEIKMALPKAFSIYFVGNESIALGSGLKLIEKEDIKKIKGIPHCQLLRI